ncbi:MAG: hypothetical protein NVSMB65_03460 [Chloroflexota bacterium]
MNDFEDVALPAGAEARGRRDEYHSIFEATSDAMAIYDWDGRVVETNPAACQMLGYSYAELIGLHVTALAHPDYHAEVIAAFEAIREGGATQGQGLVRRKDGTIFFCEGRASRFLYRGTPHVLMVTRDITEQVETEARLREKEEQYRGIFESTTDGVIIADRDGVVVEANPAAYRMHGYTHDEFIGLDHAAFVHPDYYPLYSQYVQALEAGGQFQCRAIDVRKDGTPVHVEVHGTTFTYRGTAHRLAVLRDVTERVLVEEQLREREAQYRAIFESTGDALIISDQHGYCVEANPAACRMYGYTYTEMIGLHATMVTHPDYHDLAGSFLEALTGGNSFEAESLALRKDGTPFNIETQAAPFTFRGTPHILAMVRDVTERVRAAEMLREREEQYRRIFEATSDGLIINDPTRGVVVEANPAVCRMHGYSYAEFIGLRATDFIHPDYHHVFEDFRQTIMQGGTYQTQALDRRKDGTDFHVEVRGSAVMYQGRPHILAVVRDVTERVQARALLEQRVDARTRELAALLDVSHTIASTLELHPLLDLVLDQLWAIVPYDGAAVLTVDGERLRYVARRAPTSLADAPVDGTDPAHIHPIIDTIRSGRPVIIDDVRGEEPLARRFRLHAPELMDTQHSYVRSWMGIPMTWKAECKGMVLLASSQPGFYTEHHARMALAIAQQAAIAIENARLYGQVQNAAALEERQRLARELHDSVSQALYGIALGAETTRVQLARDPAGAGDSNDYVRSLATVAMAEMRALIFELRPESLESEGLVAGLQKQAAALAARFGVSVETILCPEPAAAMAVKEALYRIALEALHNAFKHARPQRVEVRLEMPAPDVLTLDVRDDGAGFITGSSFPGHLGLRSMAERAARLGGTCVVESTVGRGTCVRARLPVHGAPVPGGVPNQVPLARVAGWNAGQTRPWRWPSAKRRRAASAYCAMLHSQGWVRVGERKAISAPYKPWSCRHDAVLCCARRALCFWP